MLSIECYEIIYVLSAFCLCLLSLSLFFPALSSGAALYFLLSRRLRKILFSSRLFCLPPLPSLSPPPLSTTRERRLRDDLGLRVSELLQPLPRTIRLVVAGGPELVEEGLEVPAIGESKFSNLRDARGHAVKGGDALAPVEGVSTDDSHGGAPEPSQTEEAHATAEGKFSNLRDARGHAVKGGDALAPAEGASTDDSPGGAPEPSQTDEVLATEFSRISVTPGATVNPLLSFSNVLEPS